MTADEQTIRSLASPLAVSLQTRSPYLRLINEERGSSRFADLCLKNARLVECYLCVRLAPRELSTEGQTADYRSNYCTSSDKLDSFATKHCRQIQRLASDRGLKNVRLHRIGDAFLGGKWLDGSRAPDWLIT